MARIIQNTEFGEIKPGFSPRARSLATATAALAPADEGGSASVCSCDAVILRNGVAVTDANRNVQVGDRITLKVKCGDCVLTNFQWSIPGTIFQNYEPSTASAILTPVPPGELKKQELYFYWADAAEGRKITCKFTATKDGTEEDCFAVATFNVIRPTVSFTAVIGIYDMVAVGKQVKIILLPNAADHTHGIDFKADVRIQNGFDFPEGKWHAVQRLTLQNYRKKHPSGNCEEHHQNGQTVLDTTYPYAPYSPDVSLPREWDAKIASNEKKWDDDPSDSLGGAKVDYDPVNFLWVYTDAKYRADFEMYIMYKPGSANSRWVPLKRINWWTDTCQYHNIDVLGTAGWTYGGTYTNAANRCYVTEAFDTSQHPTWTAVVDKVWAPITCPTFCRP